MKNLEKLAQTKVAENHVLMDILKKVQSEGLHKVAAKMHNMPEVTLNAAVYSLATKLAFLHMKNRRVNAGLEALSKLSQR